MSEDQNRWDELNGVDNLWAGPNCMNCGEAKREVSENGGWCDTCEGIERRLSPEQEAARVAKMRAELDAAVKAMRVRLAPLYASADRMVERMRINHRMFPYSGRGRGRKLVDEDR